ncbi:MAG: nuclear transport factor 2 family protein [Candidatus Heimdallarchaeota archaeon]|nr:nuclear transport factor 2 family protein [Candidatus Heimdallarchaeota archaeon]MCK5145015.1 nuclear transport factor 2 family protein [Candidatus Heimdallarchaeota archaeon]
MTEINRDAIIEVVKNKINRAFEAGEKLDSEAVLAHYHNHADFRFVALVFGQEFNLNYDEFTITLKGVYETMKEQKVIRETEFFNVLSETKVLYNTTGTGCLIPKEGERMESNLIITMIFSLIDGEWKIIHETEANIPKKEE